MQTQPHLGFILAISRVKTHDPKTSGETTMRTHTSKHSYLTPTRTSKRALPQARAWPQESHRLAICHIHAPPSNPSLTSENSSSPKHRHETNALFLCAHARSPAHVLYHGAHRVKSTLRQAGRQAGSDHPILYNVSISNTCKRACVQPTIPHLQSNAGRSMN